jgi:hypothetical protein
MNMVLLRVGIDSGCGGIQGPVFADGSFEFVCMPDATGTDPRTYGTARGRGGRTLIDFFSASRHGKMARQSIHVDPEFETFTYGDPTGPKAGLRRLRRGDLLVFYAGLTGFQCDVPAALYLIGYFDIERIGLADELGEDCVRKEFAGNFHVRHESIFQRDRPDLLLIKGKPAPQSRLLTRACHISSVGQDVNGRPLKVLSPEMRKVFGDFGGRNSIQRSPPRWVDPAFVPGAAEFVRNLP